MNKMFRVLGFLIFLMALLFFASDLVKEALVFFLQACIFTILGYLNLQEKTYLYIFLIYMLLSFLGIVTYATILQS